MQIEEALWKYFHIRTFRPLQKEIITSILAQKDTLAVLPTGAGKSLCFQLPAVLLPGVTIVISPLIALMHDQVTKLTMRSIPAVHLSSLHTKAQLDAELTAIAYGVYKLVYISPERLQNQKIQALFTRISVSLIVIDEAHCISTWGHEFRPEYRQISQFVSKLSQRPPLLALTATATPDTVKDITTVLSMHSPAIFRGTMKRENLQIHVIPLETAEEQDSMCAGLIRKHAGQQTVIFTATRSRAEELVESLHRWFPELVSIAVFHAKLDSSEKMLISSHFRSGKLQTIVATTAFGMGLDFPNIRCVIHAQLPGGFAQYAQEIGRAGRDGAPSDCYLLFHENDIHIQEALFSQSSPTVERKKILTKELTRFCDYCRKMRTCRQLSIARYFGEKTGGKCGNCDVCTNTIRTNITLAKKMGITAFEIEKLIKIRQQLAERYTVHPRAIAHDMQLLWLLISRPKNTDDILQLPGFGKGWTQRWAGYFLSSMIK